MRTRQRNRSTCLQWRQWRSRPRKGFSWGSPSSIRDIPSTNSIRTLAPATDPPCEPVHYGSRKSRIGSKDHELDKGHRGCTSKSPERLLPARPRHEAVHSRMANQIHPVALDQLFRRYLDPLILQKHLILTVLDHLLGIGQTECRCRSSDHRHRLRMDRLGLDATAAAGSGAAL
jgi:hypothetical protein